jgi:hydroxymethylglutaryl-CoA reductase
VPPIIGFSKLSPTEKLQRLIDAGILSRETADLLVAFTPSDPEMAGLLARMTENVVSSYPLPYSIAPGFLINGREFAVPMVTEESSVVAAASWSARYWSGRGGFSTRVVAQVKTGQIHFTWGGDADLLKMKSGLIFEKMKTSVSHLTAAMEKRGGGISGLELIDLTGKIRGLYQIRVSFNTADSMGANFINGCLEGMTPALIEAISTLPGDDHRPEVIMSILSNHTPDCRVICTVECRIDQLTDIRGVADPFDFARRFELAVNIARVDPFRAVTHNKGIYNGIDAVMLATANDFRAVEAAGHAYASQSGQYTSLTEISLAGGIFRYTLEVPMAVGTVGGLTRTHPLAAASLEIMNNPDAGTLMQIAASAGLANNFAAIKALITTGIQAGHMPLHSLKQKSSGH